MVKSEQYQNSNILDIHVKGEVEAEDYEQLRPLIDQITNKFDKVHLLMSVERMDMTPAAMWEDLKLSSHLGDFGRMALVTDKDWLNNAADLADALPGLELRHFEPSQREAALGWLNG